LFFFLLLNDITFYFYRNGPRLRQVDSFTNIMNIASGEKDCMLTMRENVITSLVNSLQDRFCDALTGVIGATMVADFTMWPSSENTSGTYMIFLSFPLLLCCL
jgi:hypothetical protein